MRWVLVWSFYDDVIVLVSRDFVLVFFNISIWWVLVGFK